MATNADQPDANASTVADDDKPVTEEDLRSLKYDESEVEPPQEEDETDEEVSDDESDDETAEDDGQTTETPDEEEDQPEEEDDQPQQFVKEFTNLKGDTPEEYARSLEIALNNSTSEAMRLKSIVDSTTSGAPKTEPDTEEEPVDLDNIDPVNLYAKQQMDKDISKAYSAFRKDYSQVEDFDNYQKFTKTVGILSRAILESEGRLAAPDELYSMAATTLKWQKTSEPSEKEKLGMTLKNTSASSRTTTSPGSKPPVKSKVTQAMIDANKKMYPGKTDDEIRKELEPYIN